MAQHSHNVHLAMAQHSQNVHAVHTFDVHQIKSSLFLLPSCQTSSRVKLEEDDVPVLYDVVFSLLSVTTSCLDCSLRTMLLKVSELHNLRHDESLFEVSVNSTSTLGAVLPF